MSCMYSEKGLDLDTAIKTLENIEDYETIHQPPIKPKGGEVFIYLPHTINEQENYKCDQYRWLNSGPKEIPRKNPLVKKQYFIGKLPTGKTQVFQKHCYALINDQRSPYPVLLHYIGDASVMVDFPHGNSKKSNNIYFAIAPSVRRDIANRSINSLPTAVINAYKSNTGVYNTDEEGKKEVNPVLTPRNKSQVRNIRRKQKLNNISHGIPNDDLDVLHSVSQELVGFCHYVRTKPDFMCIVGIPELKTELENLMKLTNNIVVFSFLESYKVGRYTITPFNYIHSAFSEQPAIPCYFLISEQTDFFIYEKFLHLMLDMIPGLRECQTAVITNQDYHFASALSVVFSNWLQVYDWEILFAATRAFLRKMNIDIKDISQRIKQIRALMSCDSLESYNFALEKAQKDWSPHLMQYYSQVLAEQIQTRLGRWILEKYKIYTSHMGVNRGVNSDVQIVVKQLQDLRDASLDVMLPCLFHLQTYLLSVIKKSFCNNGKLNLNSAFKFLKQDVDEMVLPCKIYEPAGIVRIFRVRGITLFSEDKDCTEDESNTLLQAQRILEMGNISHCSNLKAFLVKSTSGSLHGVQLFPRESCSCSINQRCAHIMAVMMALGMPVSYDKKGSIKFMKPQAVPMPSDDTDLTKNFSTEPAMKTRLNVSTNTSLNESVSANNGEVSMEQSNSENISLDEGGSFQVVPPNISGAMAVITTDVTGSMAVVTPVNVTATPNTTPKTFEEIAAAATKPPITPLEHAESFNSVENDSEMQPVAISYTPVSFNQLFKHVNGGQLGNVLQAVQGNEVLMVIDGANQLVEDSCHGNQLVDEPSHGNQLVDDSSHEKSRLLTYDGGETLVAYSKEQDEAEQNHDVSNLQAIEGELSIDTSCMDHDGHDGAKNGDQLINQ